MDSKTVNPTLSVYLGAELAERVAEAKAANTFDPKDVCKDAILVALGDKTADDSDPGREELFRAREQNEGLQSIILQFQDLWTQVCEIIDPDLMALTGDEASRGMVAAIQKLKERASVPLLIQESAAQPVNSGAVDYDVSTPTSDDELMARLDLLQQQGGRPLSLAVRPDGSYVLLAAWPAGQ